MYASALCAVCGYLSNQSGEETGVDPGKYKFGDNTRGLIWRGVLKKRLWILKAKLEVYLSK